MSTRVQPFQPTFMKVGILTAALQELTPRDVRDRDPDRAIEEWAAFARKLGADNMQLSAGSDSRRRTSAVPLMAVRPLNATLDS